MRGPHKFNPCQQGKGTKKGRKGKRKKERGPGQRKEKKFKICLHVVRVCHDQYKKTSKKKTRVYEGR